ncbi:MAG: UDP-glucose 4-epimerase [Myxococcaceae bacterium]|nr:UDP-glucose 4-epimerase [Myxococcaceae bacterium]
MLSSVPPPPPPAGRYLVTGAGGFIGSHLVRRLSAAGCEVVAADLTRPSALLPNVDFVRCDLRDRTSVRDAVRASRATRAVHLAARVGDWGPAADFEALNVTGAQWVLEAVAEAGFAHAIHVSSIVVLGQDAGALATEGAPVVTDGPPYTATKARGELVAKKLQLAGAPITVVRPGDVYGVGSVPWVVRPIELLRKRQMLLVDGGRGHFAHLHVDNLVDGFVHVFAAPQSKGETFILTDGDHHMTMGEYFGRLADAVGLAPPSLSLPRVAARALAATIEAGARLTGTTPPFTRAAVDYVLRVGSFDTRKARDGLHWTPRVTLEEGLREIGRHYGRLVT